MVFINQIEMKIKELDGGTFQGLGDQYLIKKYHFSKPVALGSQEGTNKTTKGVPDIYFENNGKYVYVMYGTHKNVFKKLEDDISSVKEMITNTEIEYDKVERIICCHTSSNIRPDQMRQLEKLAQPYQLEIIGINEIANDLTKIEFQFLAKEYLGIIESTEQVWNIEDFIRIHDNSRTNAPISNDYIGDPSKMIKNFDDIQVLLIADKPGTGKTRSAIEICKELDENRYNILCVKSNGQPVYMDIKRYLDSKKENIIFIDDINSVEDHDSVLSLLRDNKNIKFIITARDYVVKEISGIIKNYDYKLISPNKLEKEQMEQLTLQFVDSKINNAIIDHIVKISKNNPRIAVLAAKLYTKNSDRNFSEVVDVLKDYYSEILETNGVTQIEEKVLFVLSYLKKINLDNFSENKELLQLMEILNLTQEQLLSGIKKLSIRELCNTYSDNDKLVRVADQSLDDYIVVKFLESSTVSVSSLLNNLYSLNNEKVIGLLNQFASFSTSKKVLKLLENDVRAFYEDNNFINSTEKENFLTQFGALIPEEAYIYLNNKLAECAFKEYSISDFMDKGDTGESMDISVFSIISTLSNLGENYSKFAFELLLKYFQKDPNMISKVYTILKNNFSVIIEGKVLDYNNAEYVMEELSNLDLEKRYNQELLVKIIDKFLTVRDKYTYFERDEVNIVNFVIPESESLIKYHEKLLTLLARIHFVGKKEIKEYVQNILLDYKYKIKENIGSHPNMVKEDLENIKRLFFREIRSLTMEEERVVYQLDKASKKVDLSVFNGYKVTERQKVYTILTTNRFAYLYGKNENKQKLKEIAENYRDSMNKVFRYASQFKKSRQMNNYRIDKVLYNVFALQDMAGRYKFLAAMFSEKYHFESVIPDRFIDLLDEDDSDSVIDALRNIEQKERYKWEIAALLTLDAVTVKDVDRLKKILDNNSIPEYYSIVNFEKFILVDNSLKEFLLQKNSTTKFIIPDVIYEEDAKKLVTLFGVEPLKRLYLNNFGQDIDIATDLFYELGKNDIEFSVEILKKLNNFENVQSEIAEGILYNISRFEDKYVIYQKYFQFILEKENWGYYDSLLKDIIDMEPRSVVSMLQNETDESQAIKILNWGIENLEDSETKLTLFKILKDKGFGKNTYQNIHFVSLSKSWWGSYVPVLESEMIFLDKIKEIFGADRDYIKLIRHVKRVISEKDLEINRERENEFLNNDR